MLGVLIVLGIVLKWIVKFVAPMFRRVNHFLDDFLGEPERPGKPAQPGLMERMARQDMRVDDLVESVRFIEDEFKYNHGSTVKDALRRVEGALADLSGRMDSHLSGTAPVPVVTTVVNN